jgi:hypothetical protein
MPECRVESTYQKVEKCRNPDLLLMSRITHKFIEHVKETALTTIVTIGKFDFFLQDIKIDSKKEITKSYLCKEKKASPKSLPTAWIVERTKDSRYIWRGDIDIDKKDVENLLKFILINRNPSDQCPSILINAGSHGGIKGRNAHATGNFSQT